VNGIVKNTSSHLRLYLLLYCENGVLSGLEVAKTPYEVYLKQSISEEKTRLDSLYNEFAKSNPIKRQILKHQIEEAVQNIELLSADLGKYGHGLSWLREPSKERDEKAEHLPKLEKEAAPPAAAAKPATPGQAKPISSRPTIGKPVGSTTVPSIGQPVTPRPSVGTPVARPKIGSPIGTPNSQAHTTPVQQPSANNVQAPVAKPVVGTPVKRPVIGTPIGTPRPQKTEQDGQDNSESS
jgi:hypothetical protein